MQLHEILLLAHPEKCVRAGKYPENGNWNHQEARVASKTYTCQYGMILGDRIRKILRAGRGIRLDLVQSVT